MTENQPEKGNPMKTAFVMTVTRDNVMEKVRVFTDYDKAAAAANDLAAKMSIRAMWLDPPAFLNDETWKFDGICIGVTAVPVERSIATITATLRDTEFCLRADWSDPDCDIEIRVCGYEFEPTGEKVSQYGVGVDGAMAALISTVSIHFDDWRAPDIDGVSVMRAAKFDDCESSNT